MNYEQVLRENQSRADIAKALGHNTTIVDNYERLKLLTSVFNNDDISELDIIYFLKNILWSTNFELIAAVIKDYGMESRLDQWKEALK